jgi:uncharacterized protein (TIGR00290 family)
MKEPILLSWSGGKDAAVALYELQRSASYEVTALLTTVAEKDDRVPMHGVRRSLVQAQAAALGLPLHAIYLPTSSSDDQYAELMKQALLHHAHNGVSGVAFGDIFLEDVRTYREEKLATIDMTAVFPLWERSTSDLASWFVQSSFKAIVTCVDSQVLPGSMAGSTFDEGFLQELPPGVDPCGENGEFHTFVYDGPIFHRPIPFRKGEVAIEDDRFYYCDLLPANSCRLAL